MCSTSATLEDLGFSVGGVSLCWYVPIIASRTRVSPLHGLAVRRRCPGTMAYISEPTDNKYNAKYNERMIIYRVSQEEWTKLRESVPYVELYRYNPKHLYPKLNGYGDNGQRSYKVLTAVTHLLITKYILKLAGICGFCNVNICT